MKKKYLNNDTILPSLIFIMNFVGFICEVLHGNADELSPTPQKIPLLLFETSLFSPFF
jgi:hypothetical protein